MFFTVPSFEACSQEGLKAEYLSWFRAEMLQHCNAFKEPAQKLGCQQMLADFVENYGPLIFALDMWITEWCWVIIATVFCLILALLFPSMRRDALRLLASAVTYLLNAFANLLKKALAMPSKLVVSRRTHDAILVDVLNKHREQLDQQQAQVEKLKAALREEKESHDKTNRSYSDLNTLAVELKQEVKHYKELLGAEKKKNRRNSN